MTTEAPNKEAAGPSAPAAAAQQSAPAPTQQQAAGASGGGGLSEEMRRIIRGEAAPAEKDAAYNASLQRWWSEYAGRKNEEEDMVADSLLYDERCHLPRTTAGPRFDGAQQQQQPGPAGGANGHPAAANGSAGK